jgi:hypothetical protein
VLFQEKYTCCPIAIDNGTPIIDSVVKTTTRRITAQLESDMIIKYQSSVKVAAGWRSVEITAEVEKISAGTVRVIKVTEIDGESPDYGMSRTGARRQEFNGKFWANTQIGLNKRLSACEIIEAQS